MILTTHALVGAAIGKNINNVWIVIFLSLAIHFILDSFRHGEYFDDRHSKFKDTWWKVTLDIFIGLFMIFSYLAAINDTSRLINILVGAFFSMFPDLLTVIYWKFRWSFLKKIKAFHAWSHHYGKFPKYSPERQWTLRNALNDIIISIIAIIILFL